MANRSYGLAVYRPINFVAVLRGPRGECAFDQAQCGSRREAYARIAEAAAKDGFKVETLTAQEDLSIEDQERWGLIPVSITPARFDWAKLDCY